MDIELGAGRVTASLVRERKAGKVNEEKGNGLGAKLVLMRSGQRARSGEARCEPSPIQLRQSQRLRKSGPVRLRAEPVDRASRASAGMPPEAGRHAFCAHSGSLDIAVPYSCCLC